MLASRPSSPTKLLTSKLATTLWTARLVATLWKLAVQRVRKLRRKSQDATNHFDSMYDSTSNASRPTSEDEEVDLDEASILREAALSVVASGIVSLADLEAVTGYCLSKNEQGQMLPSKDDDENSDAATDTSDSYSIAGSDVSENVLDEDTAVANARQFLKQRVHRGASTSSTKTAKWICIGYGRYVKVQE